MFTFTKLLRCGLLGRCRAPVRNLAAVGDDKDPDCEKKEEEDESAKKEESDDQAKLEEDDFKKYPDFVQKLFLEKIREYAEKSKECGGKLVDPTPEIEKEWEQQLHYLSKRFKITNDAEMEEFPTFNFEEPKLDSQVTCETDGDEKKDEKQKKN